MKSIDVELGKSNMLPLIASQQFYASWKVFIRELLLNAMDACDTLLFGYLEHLYRFLERL